MRTLDARVAFSPNHHGLDKKEKAVEWDVLAALVKGAVAPQVGAKGKGKRKRAGGGETASKRQKGSDGAGTGTGVRLEKEEYSVSHTSTVNSRIIEYLGLIS